MALRIRRLSTSRAEAGALQPANSRRALTLFGLWPLALAGCSSIPGIAPAKSGWASLSYGEYAAKLKRLDVGLGEMAYLDEGSGPPVVLVHGIPTSSWMYRKTVQPLLDAGHRVIAPDLMGLGSSDRLEDTNQLLVSAQAGYLGRLLLDELHLENWTHVVHDFGGPITWRLMEDPRVSIKRLVILDTFAFEEGWEPGLDGITLAAMRVGMTPPFDETFYSVAIKGMVHDSGVATDRMRSGYCGPLVAGGSTAYECLYGSSNDLKEDLAGFQHTLSRYSSSDVRIVWGRHDEFLSADGQLKALQSLLQVPASRTSILENVGHLVAEEDPATVVSAILSE